MAIYTTPTAALVLLAVQMWMTLTVAEAHGDDVCMLCPCGPSWRCSGNAAVCCAHFQTHQLTELSVSVNCSRPAHSHIVDPIGPPYSLVQPSANCSGFHVVHEHSCLSAMPDNYCQYGDTRAVSLSSNSLSQFPNLTCLSKLGRLDLTNNKLRAVPRDAFKGLKYLREVFLDNNEIDYIHPKVFHSEDLLELSIFSVSSNRLLSLEPWPMSLHYSFCYFDFSHNLATNFTNHGHWKFNTSQGVTYGPGFVDLTYNRFVEGPMGFLKEVGIKKFIDTVKFMRWGVDFRHNPFLCDCQFYEVVYWAQKLRKIMWRDYFNITCSSPPKFRGLPVVDLPLDELTCIVTEGCPRGCRCEDRPSEHGIVVVCDDAGMTSLPDVMPKGANLILHLANNSFRQLPPRQYFTRAKVVDLRGNGLKNVEEKTLRLLRDAELVDLRHNELRHLPATFQALNPEALLLDLHTLKCSCDLEWFRAWLRHSRGHQVDNVTCATEGGEQILLKSASRDDLGCNVHSEHLHTHRVVVIVASVMVVVTASFLVVFRYEVLVMTHRCAASRAAKRKKQRFSALLNSPHSDVFISVNGASVSDSDWVMEVLLPALNRHGLSSYLPFRDCTPGDVELEEATKHIHDSTAVLVVLSPDYLHSGPCLSQFSQAYSHMSARKHGHLLLVKRSSVSTLAPREPRLRAMLRLRMFHTADPEHLDNALATLAALRDPEV